MGVKSKDSTDSPGEPPQYSTSPLCVGYSEIDKYAIQIYEKHFNHKNYGNITEIIAEELPDFDLLVGGFPCQAFSIAGKRKGFEDTRGTLFFDLARILRAKQPRLFVFENVKGLLSHDNGNTFKTIISTLDELGYDLQWQVLNSKNHGVPQNRERVFIIGNLRGTPRPKVFPFGQDDGVSASPAGAEPRRTQTEISHTLKGNNVKADNVFIKVCGDLDKRKTYLGDIASTLAANPTSDNTARVLLNARIRRLTPTECARLQGFPDNWHEGVSDSQAYKVYGNAVTVNTVQDVMERLLNQAENK